MKKDIFYAGTMLKAKEEIAAFEMFETARKDKAVKIKEKHFCNGCVWGRWAQNIRFCMFPRCAVKNPMNKGDVE